MTSISRRSVLAGATATPCCRTRAGRRTAPLQVFAHRVHKTVAVGTQGGDVTAAWTRQSGTPVEWTTFDTGPLAGAPVPRGGSRRDLGRRRASSSTRRRCRGPRNSSSRSTPSWRGIPSRISQDVFSGLVDGMKIGGKMLAMPYRHASSGLHWNEEILAERGFPEAAHRPSRKWSRSAKACTYRRADGTACVGLCMPGVTYPNVIDLARAWDGDFITPDYKVVADQPGMLNAIRLLRDLFQAGAFPRNFAALTTEDVATWMQQGRAAMALQSMGRNRIFNDPQKSRFAGKIQTGAVPISASLKDRYAVAPAKVEYWGMAIPRNAKRKDLSWSFIKAMMTKEATLAMALNGNGPVRASTYDDAGFRATVPYADAERDVLKVARVPLPAFDEAARAGDIFKEEAEAAVLGMKTPEVAMASVVQRVKPLLPS